MEEFKIAYPFNNS